jgi:hypothetical protein
LAVLDVLDPDERRPNQPRHARLSIDLDGRLVVATNATFGPDHSWQFSLTRLLF